MLQGPDWGERAKRALKAELKAHGVTYADLAERLTAAGAPETEANIRSKIARGRFTAAFLLQSFYVIGARTITIPND